jgi:hypothetical protein
MRTLSFFLVLLLALLFSAALADDPPLEFRGYRWFDQRIAFEYDRSLGDSVGSTYIPQDIDLSEVGPGGPMPETVQITFERYVDQDGGQWQPTGAYVNVYHTGTFPGADEPASQVYTGLRELLSLDEAGFAAYVEAESIPTMSQITTSQVFTAQVERIDFQTGSGVRFVTAGALDVSPLTDAMIYYDFQGLTADGNYYISATFPLSTPVLPDEFVELTGEAYDEFAAQYDEYIASVTAELNALVFSEFDPDLTLLDDLIGSLAVESPLATFYPREATIIEYENLTFQVNPVLAQRVEVDHIPGIPVEEFEMTMFGASPDYYAFSLAGFPITVGLHAPQVMLFRTAEFPDVEISAYTTELNRLQRLLAERPTLTSRAADWESEPLPLLPPVNAAQIMAIGPQFVDFENGTGLRYLALYGQDAAPVTADRLFYAFAGLSDDGETVIAAQFPLFVPSLPDSIDYAVFDYEAFIDEMDEYLAETLAQLVALPDDEFVPDLSLLDTLVSSFQVD